MKITVICIMLVSLFTLFNVNLLLAEQTKEDIAIQAAIDWLSLVDEEKYGESWCRMIKFGEPEQMK